jgi:hypothetical protein
MEELVNSEIQRVITGIREIRKNYHIIGNTPHFDHWEEKFGTKKS